MRIEDEMVERMNCEEYFLRERERDHRREGKRWKQLNRERRRERERRRKGNNVNTFKCDTLN